MSRRTFLAELAGLPFFLRTAKADEAKHLLKIMMKSAWCVDEQTRAAFPFSHVLVLSEAGHEVRILLLAEAASLMRKTTANAILPVGWPPLSETLQKIGRQACLDFLPQGPAPGQVGSRKPI
jgi:hypothetical protein